MKDYNKRRNTMKQYRQGDVLIESATIPKAARRITAKRIVLAEGEATGHVHEIATSEAVELFEHNGTTYLRVKEAAPVTHQEHLTITIPPGRYIVTRQREYSPE